MITIHGLMGVVGGLPTVSGAGGGGLILHAETANLT